MCCIMRKHLAEPEVAKNDASKANEFVAEPEKTKTPVMATSTSLSNEAVLQTASGTCEDDEVKKTEEVLVTPPTNDLNTRTGSSLEEKKPVERMAKREINSERNRYDPGYKTLPTSSEWASDFDPNSVENSKRNRTRSDVPIRKQKKLSKCK